MKKILLLFICLFVLPLMVSATEYTVTDLDLTIDFPDNYIVITRDNYKNNEQLEELDITESYIVKSIFNDLNVYVNAYDEENEIEIFFLAIPTEETNTNDLTDDQKSEINSTTLDELPDYVKTDEEVEFIKIGDHQYYTLKYYDDSYKYYVYDVYYVYNGIKYAFKVQALNEFEDIEVTEFNEIIKSIEYSEEEILLKDIPVKKDADKKEDDDGFNLLFLVPVVSIVIIVFVIVFIIRKRRKTNG